MSIRTIAQWLLVLVGALTIAACGAGSATAPPAPTPPANEVATAAPSTMAGMDHGAMTGDVPYDATFIDSMIVHHESAIAMANQALQEAARPEVKALAQAIVAAQEAEIAQLRAWRATWYPELAETAGMAMDMGPMEVVAGAEPFDQRFIQAMIPHHEGAIAMARDALQNAEHQEIKDLAQAVVTAQEGEVTQMTMWLQEWYGITL